MKARELNQNWTMRCVEDLQWQEAIVPGTVYTDLPVSYTHLPWSETAKANCQN